MKRRQSFLFELDALVDTRYGLLVKTLPERVNSVNIDAYRERMTNYVWEYFGTTKEDWEATWANRDITVLGYSGPTELLLRLNELFITPLTGAATSPLFARPKLIVNTYPYEFNEAQLKIVEEELRNVVLSAIEIELIYLNHKDLTPSWLSKHVDVYTVYDLTSWFALHGESLTKTPIPNVIIHYPALLTEGRESDSVFEKRGLPNAFDELSITLCEFITLRAIDPKLYSIPPVS